MALGFGVDREPIVEKNVRIHPNETEDGERMNEDQYQIVKGREAS
jgi:hypothetical protein